MNAAKQTQMLTANSKEMVARENETRCINKLYNIEKLFFVFAVSARDKSANLHFTLRFASGEIQISGG
ncbi:hypothetical protein [Methanimicrococcus blatticola]|uniref:hypothetical protein n=1 Tax=Methanimicrococcus blatticola TaxID=91560 RepID=UPI001414DE16|nr:hypothetical protein [Methanimicrococcus blatticola]MCC2509255.1 hypothetical protein [Methanimicrococcus blatticola]